MNKVEWRLYYDDGSTFTNLDGDPNDVPAYGFVCAVFPDHDVVGNNIGRFIMWGWDFYYWHEEHKEWWGCNLTGLIDRLAARLPMVGVCIGRTVHNTVYREIMGRADSDPDFPRKSAKHRLEGPSVTEGPVTEAFKNGA